MSEKTLLILPTAYCSLNCSHCAANSNIQKPNQALAIKKICEILENSSNIGFSNVHISGGGEPLTLSDDYIKDLLNSISKYGYFINMTTNGFWAHSNESAYEKMLFLSQNGLKQLIISLSESHLEFIPIQNLINICRNQKKVNIQVVVYITENNEKSDLTNYFLSTFKKLQIPTPIFSNGNYIIPLGRAEKSFDSNLFYLKDVNSFNINCKSICNNICIHPDGSVTPCAMVAVLEMKRFIFGNIYNDDFVDIYKKIQNDKVNSFIREKGVVKLKELIEGNSKKRYNSKYVNMCHLCYSIHTSYQNDNEFNSLLRE